MIKAFYTGKTGAISSQTNLDVISNNLANLQTDGYKSQKGEFLDLLYTNMSQNDGSLMIGTGSKLDKIDSDFSTGAIYPTGQPTDYAINGDGFFGIQVGEEIYYTRSGSFHEGYVDGEKYLMFDNGFVLDNNEEPILLDEIGDEFQVGVYDFQNKADLELAGDSLFRLTNEDAEFEIMEEPEVLQGYVESSNVDLATEMTRIIKSQRAFQFNTRIIQVADEIEQTVNSLTS